MTYICRSHPPEGDEDDGQTAYGVVKRRGHCHVAGRLATGEAALGGLQEIGEGRIEAQRP